MIEEIEALLPLLGQITDGGIGIAIAFVVFKFVKMFVVAGVVVYLITIPFRAVARISYSFNLYRNISEELDLDTRTSDIYESDVKQVLNRVKELNRRDV